MTKRIDQALGLTPLPMTLSVDSGKENRNLVNQQQIDTDLDTSRDNLHNALEISKEALTDLLMIARQSQHPRAYEVLNSMVRTYTDISMSLPDYQIKKQKLQMKSAGDDDGPANITNNLFVGSTTELLQMMNKLNNKEED
jgi:hypothetical protein